MTLMKGESMMRLKYHIAPNHGFLNDPNGLAQFQGKYHVFYQWLPDVTPQGSKIWRHCVSQDLIHWSDEGCGLEPTEWYEKNGCYSGSGIVDHGKYYLFYTGNVRGPQGERETYQCVAVSDNGETFQKEGPVVYLPEAYTPHFRDPKVWKKDEHYWMVVGAQTKELLGNVALFESDDLREWTWKGSILDQSLDWGYMCECPDLMEIDGYEFLVVSRQKTEGCRGLVFEGKMDYQNGKFAVNQASEKLLDEGFDFYAPQSFVDESGRRLLFGWLGAGEIDYQMTQPTVKEGWLHTLTIPRELFVYNGELCQRPAKELEGLRTQEQVVEEIGEFSIERGSFSLEFFAENLKEQSVSFDFGEVLKINYQKEEKILQMKRKRWSESGYDEKQISLSELEQIRVFLDQSTAEIFVNHGEKVFTCKAFFDSNTEIKVTTNETIKIKTWLIKE